MQNEPHLYQYIRTSLTETCEKNGIVISWKPDEYEGHESDGYNTAKFQDDGSVSVQRPLYNSIMFYPTESISDIKFYEARVVPAFKKIVGLAGNDTGIECWLHYCEPERKYQIYHASTSRTYCDAILSISL